MKTKSNIVKPENVLKKKVGNGGFKEGDIIKAQSSIENNTIDFRPIATDLLAQLDLAIEELKEVPVKVPESLNNSMFPMMQLKAQGSLFKYPAVTKISHAMLDFLENINTVNDDVIAIVIAYRNSIKALIAMEIKDITHKASNQLLMELEKAFVRYHNQRAKQGSK